eukprot:172426_1
MALNPDGPLYRFEVYRTIFLSAFSFLISLYVIQIVNQEVARRKFGKKSGTVQTYGRPLLLFSTICLAITHLDLYQKFGILNADAVVFLDYHFVLGIFAFLGIYIFSLTSALEEAMSNQTSTTKVLTIGLYLVLIVNGYASTILRVVLNERWTVVYQNINLLLYIWASIFRLMFTYIKLAKLIRSTHVRREQSKINRMETAIRKWRFTIALIIAFSIALTTLRLVPIKLFVGENAYKAIPPLSNFNTRIIFFDAFKFGVLTVYLYAVWEPLVLFTLPKRNSTDSDTETYFPDVKVINASIQKLPMSHRPPTKSEYEPSVSELSAEDSISAWKERVSMTPDLSGYNSMIRQHSATQPYSQNSRAIIPKVSMSPPRPQYEPSISVLSTEVTNVASEEERPARRLRNYPHYNTITRPQSATQPYYQDVRATTPKVTSVLPSEETNISSGGEKPVRRPPNYPRYNPITRPQSVTQTYSQDARTTTPKVALPPPRPRIKSKYAPSISVLPTRETNISSEREKPVRGPPNYPRYNPITRPQSVTQTYSQDARTTTPKVSLPPPRPRIKSKYAPYISVLPTRETNISSERQKPVRKPPNYQRFNPITRPQSTTHTFSQDVVVTTPKVSLPPPRPRIKSKYAPSISVLPTRETNISSEREKPVRGPPNYPRYNPITRPQSTTHTFSQDVVVTTPKVSLPPPRPRIKSKYAPSISVLPTRETNISSEREKPVRGPPNYPRYNPITRPQSVTPKVPMPPPRPRIR